jgi:hypothetical protein
MRKSVKYLGMDIGTAVVVTAIVLLIVFRKPEPRNRSNPKKVLSAGRISIKTSKDPVGAPLFYREVNLPFVDAVKDPSLMIDY